MFQGYFYIEALSMTAQQKQTLVDALKAFGSKNDSIFPHEKNHWATRPDNNAVIFEAIFDDALLTAEAFKTRLAGIFNVAVSQVTYAIIQTAYGPAVTYTYSSVQRLRMGVFGGLSETYIASQLAAQTFLVDNSSAWNSNP